jgi:hypothetical protein
VLSIVSFLLGVLSVPLICACYLSLLTSIPAIISGHIGYYQCRRAKGALTVKKMGIVAEQPVLAQLRKPSLDVATQTQIILILAEVGGRDSFRTLQRIAANQSHPLRFSAKSAAEKIKQRLAE